MNDKPSLLEKYKSGSEKDLFYFYICNFVTVMSELLTQFSFIQFVVGNKVAYFLVNDEIKYIL